MFPENFNIQENEKGEKLVTPSHSVANYQWRNWDHRWLRSLHIDAEDRIISVGFPKFCNLNEGSGQYHISENRVLSEAGHNLWATMKIDGSLLVRFVQDGKVKWRTRGAFGIGLDNKWELDDIFAAHLMLNDPSYRPQDSLLFEWVSPLNQIVIRYDKAMIFTMGGIHFQNDCPWENAHSRLYTAQETMSLSDETQVPLMESFFLNKKDEVEKLLSRIKDSKEIEGFVLRLNDSQEMVKIKAEHYLILHALKSNLTTAKLVELWISWNRPDFQEFRSQFEAIYDYECWQWALPVVSSMYDGIREAKGIVEHVEAFVGKRKKMNRKDFALESQSRFNQLRLSLCFIFYDGKEVPASLWQKLVLQNSKQMERLMFEK